MHPEALLIIVINHQAAAHQRIQLAALEPCHSLGRFTIERSRENGQVPPLGHQAGPRPLQALDAVGQLRHHVAPAPAQLLALGLNPADVIAHRNRRVGRQVVPRHPQRQGQMYAYRRQPLEILIAQLAPGQDLPQQHDRHRWRQVPQFDALDLGQLNRLPRSNQQRRGGIGYQQPHLFTVGGIVGQHQHCLLREHLAVEAFEHALRAGNLGFRSESQDDLLHGLCGRGGRGVEAAHIDLDVRRELAAQLLAGEIGELGLADAASADDRGGPAGFKRRQQDAGFFLAPDKVANRVAQLVGEGDRGAVAGQSTLDEFVDVLHDGCK